ncbi:DUF4158 domain-containing protein, partial [Streptosporangium roseum]|uniref:DUF4158 domain-containing protein n=1 Tax=Streptosporangium roseum TaxID=2001 RepID=UPI0004CD23FB
DHQEQIRTGYGFTAFEGEQWFALACWLYKRAWTTGERPIVLFDLATHRLVEAKVLLPGVTTLERMIAALARFARAQAVAELAGDRKLATMVAFAATMDPQSADEAIEVFDLALGDLLRTSAFKANKERMRTLRDLDTAAIMLREVWLKIRSVAEIPDGDIRAALDERESLRRHEVFVPGLRK